MAEQSSPRQAEKKAIESLDTSSIVNPGTKKRSASTHEPSDRAQETHKRIPSPHVEGAENVKPSFHRTPAAKCMASHTGLTEKWTIVYASDMEKQITAEARGVTGKNIPWDKFYSTYLCDFSVKARPKLAVESMKKIGEGNWEEKPFWNRLHKVLSDEVCAFICLSVSADLLNRFFVTSTYSMAVLRHYPTLTRCLPNLISFSTSVKSLLYGQMWSFCSSIRGAKMWSLRNFRSGCAVLGVCSIINLSAVTSMGSCLYSLMPMSATLITAAPCTPNLSIS